MKYLKTFLILLSFLSIPVAAKENRVVLIEDKGNLYYDNRYIKENNFTEEVNSSKMEYQKDFVVDNQTKNKREIFLLVESIGQDGSYNDLMDSLHIKVIRDEKVLYDDTGSGIDLSHQERDLHDFISIGSFAFKEHSTIHVIIDSEEADLSGYFHYSFYYKDKDNTYTEVLKYTDDMFYNSYDIWIFVCFSIVLAGIILFVLIHRYKIENHPEIAKKKREEKEKKKEEKKNKSK